MVVGTALTLLSVVLLVVVKLRRSRSGRDQNDRQPQTEKHSGPNSTSLLHLTPGGKDLGPSGVRESVGDEKDPDIIPAKFGEFLLTAVKVVIYVQSVLLSPGACFLEIKSCSATITPECGR
jgi:hypothetical protein